MISILSPVRNESRHLPAMVASLQAQTYGDWEVIFVDDGSTDETPDLLRSMVREDKRIIVLPSNGALGKVAAFNACFAAATGDAICHVGGDDTLPPNSIADRYGPLLNVEGTAVTFCKFQTMNEEGRQFSAPLPRGSFGSTSSAGTTMNRALAETLFPIPEELPAEDIWLGRGAEYVAETVIHSEAVVLNYRQHAGNSNPRGRRFSEMTEKIHTRQRAKQLLSLADDLPISDEDRRRLETEWRSEVLRYSRNYLGLLLQDGVTIPDRLAMLSMSMPIAWKFRQVIGTHASGWRGR